MARCPTRSSPHPGRLHVPLARVHPEAEPVAHPPGSALALQRARLTDKGLHQRAHLAALVVPRATRVVEGRQVDD